MLDAGIAVENLVLAATAEGLGTVGWEFMMKRKFNNC